MSAHTCKKLTPGCYRCDLNADEFEDAVDQLTEEIEELTKDRDEAQKILTKFRLAQRDLMNP